MDPRIDPAFGHVRDWIFDLDNCLYPASSGLFELIDERMGAYIQRLLDCDADEARRVQAHHVGIRGLLREREHRAGQTRERRRDRGGGRRRDGSPRRSGRRDAAGKGASHSETRDPPLGGLAQAGDARGGHVDRHVRLVAGACAG